jgi:hypothetical protein
MAVTAVLILGGCQGQQHEYDGATREAFMQVCRQGRSSPGEQTCGCYYDQMVSRLTFDEFAKLDRSMKDDPAFTPDVVVEAISACAAEPSAPPGESDEPEEPADSEEQTDASDRNDAPDASEQTDLSESTDPDAGAGGILGQLPSL